MTRTSAQLLEDLRSLSLLTPACLEAMRAFWGNGPGREDAGPGPTTPERLRVGELACFKGHTEAVSGVAFSPDGRRAASSGHDGMVRIWDLETSQEVARLQGHDGAVMCVAFSPRGDSILSGGLDGTMRLWDAETGKQKRSFPCGQRVLGVAYFADGRRAVSAEEDPRAARTRRCASGGCRSERPTGKPLPSRRGL
jgi:WD40 repeat protein